MAAGDDRYGGYARDSAVLALIGHALDGQVLPRVTLSDHLRRAAVEAWDRDDEGPLPAVETDVQRRLRGDAGVLALIGLTIVRADRSGGELALSADLVAHAITAAHRPPG